MNILYCACGCGLELKNKLATYIHGHNRPWAGKSRSEATKEKIRLKLKGRRLSDDHKKNISLGLVGKNTWTKGRVGEKSSAWKGGRRISTYGYILVYCREHPFCDKDGYLFEHRLVIEKKLGRYLKSDEIVHHKNGKKTDNRIENLEITNRSEHKKMHSDIGINTRFKAKKNVK